MPRKVQGRWQAEVRNNPVRAPNIRDTHRGQPPCHTHPSLQHPSVQPPIHLLTLRSRVIICPSRHPPIYLPIIHQSTSPSTRPSNCPAIQHHPLSSFFLSPSFPSFLPSSSPSDPLAFYAIHPSVCPTIHRSNQPPAHPIPTAFLPGKPHTSIHDL